MKKFTIAFFMVLLSASVIYAQGLATRTTSGPSPSKPVIEKSQNPNNGGRADMYSIDFEVEVEWTFDFTPWTVVDVDFLPTYGFTNYAFPHNYEEMAYIVFDPNTTEPPMTADPEIQPHSGEQFGACMASVPSGSQGNDDWFISPQVTVGAGASFTFWAKSYTDQYGLERFNVAVSTTGNDPADFTVISGSNYQEAPIVWTEYIYDLSAYEGQAIYIAIQCVSFDAFVFMIDDLVIDPGAVATPCDNFDSYVADELLCPQSDFWTTWDNNPGGLYDGYVRNVEFVSSPNCLAIEKAIIESDLIHDLGQTVEGYWEVSLDIKIPAGTNGGYYNVMQDMELFGAGNEWGFQVYFRSDGTGKMVDAVFTNTEFTYNVDEWNHSVVVVNLDDSTAQFWLNDVLINTWQWNIDGPNKLGAIDIYAAADGADIPKFYIDNVCFQESTVGIETPVAKSEIQLFPNPADQFMTISSSENLQSVRIFNSVGQVVFQDKMDSQSIQVNVQSYKPGLYTVQVTTENGNEIKKFMKR